MSRGPRIGDEGCPYCKRPKGHEDLRHRPAIEDGWGPNMEWIDPWDPRLRSGSEEADRG